MIRVRLRPTGGDQGASLVLALAVITIVSVGLLALGTMADTNLRTITRLSAATTNTASVSDALEQTIQQMELNAAYGVDTTHSSGSDCGGAIFGAGGGTTVSAAPYGGNGNVSIVCKALAKSGLINSGSSPTNEPPFAVLATRTGASPGVTLNGNGSFKVDGDILSNSSMSASAGATLDAGTYHNWTPTGPAGCVLPTSFSPLCTIHAAQAGPFATGTGWDHAAMPATVDPAVPSSCPTGRVNVTPGTYTTADDLNALISGVGSNCAIVFGPGTFYFNFTHGSHVLTVDNKFAYVIGGDPDQLTTFGSMCKYTETNNGNAGSQFIFGGDSRLSSNAGFVELCPTGTSDAGTDQEISLYGLNTTAADRTTAATFASNGSTSTSNPGSTNDFSNANATGGFSDGQTADYAVNNGKPNSGTLTLTFPSPSFNQYSVVSHLFVRIRYKANSAQISSLAFNVSGSSGAVGSVGSNNGAGCAGAANTDPNTASNLCTDTGGGYITQTFDVGSPTSLADVSGLQTALKATTANGNGVPDGVGVSVDAVTYQVAYRLPSDESAQSGCVLVSGSCWMVQATGNGINGGFISHGSLYAWNARTSLNLPNEPSFAYARGAVAGFFDLNIPASCGASCTQPVIHIPHTGAAQTNCRDDILTATNGSSIIRAEVLFRDTGCVDARLGSTPAGGARILHWSVLR